MARKKVKKTTKKTRAKAPIDKLSNRKAYVVSYSRNGKRIRSRAIFRKKTDANKFAKKIQDNEKKNIRVVNATVAERVELELFEEIDKLK